MTLLLVPALLSACADSSELEPCDVAMGALTATTANGTTSVAGAVFSRCPVVGVEVGAWSTGTITLGSGQGFTIAIPASELVTNAGRLPSSAGNFCGDPILGADGSLTLPAAVRLLDLEVPECPEGGLVVPGSSVVDFDLSADVDWLPRTVAASAVVTLLAPSEAALGASVTWSASGGTATPAANVIAADVSSGAATAYATVTPTTGSSAVTVSASAGGLTRSLVIPVFAAPVLRIDATTVVRGGEAVPGVATTDGMIDAYHVSNCSGIDLSTTASGCEPGVTCEVGEAWTFELSAPEPSPHTSAACSLTVEDSYGQTATGTVMLAAGPATWLSIESDLEWIPNDATTSAVLTVSAPGEAAGAVVAVSAEPASLGASSLTLDWNRPTGTALASTSLRSGTAGQLRVLAQVGSALAETTVIVAGVPSVTPASLSLATGTTGTLIFETAGTLAECSYAGGGFTIEGAAYDVGDVFLPAGTMGESVVMTVSAPASASQAWCEDGHGRRTYATVTAAGGA